MIIALAGNIGVGKDAIADLLCAQHGFARTAFAKALKKLAADVFLFDDATLYGPSANRNKPHAPALYKDYWDRVESRLDSDLLWDTLEELFGSAKAPEASASLWRLYNELSSDVTGFTARKALQRLGTDWGRALDDRVWLNAVSRELRATPKTVITDCRFPNEAEFILTEGGRVVWVDASGRVAKTEASAHASEPTIADFSGLLSHILDNNGDLETLPARVESMLSALRAS